MSIVIECIEPRVEVSLSFSFKVKGFNMVYDSAGMGD